MRVRAMFSQAHAQTAPFYIPYRAFTHHTYGNLLGIVTITVSIDVHD